MVDSSPEGTYELGLCPLKGDLTCLNHRALFYILCCSRLSSIVIPRRQLTKFKNSPNLGDIVKVSVFRNKTSRDFMSSLNNTHKRKVNRGMEINEDHPSETKTSTTTTCIWQRLKDRQRSGKLCSGKMG